MTKTDLSSMKTNEIVALYNQHANKPVRKFRDRATAVARTAALLETLPGQKAPRGPGIRDVVFAVLQEAGKTGIDAAQLALLAEVPVRKARGAIDGLRRRGVAITNEKGRFHVASTAPQHSRRQEGPCDGAFSASGLPRPHPGQERFENAKSAAI
jgi:hypothetical protein